MLHLKLKTPTKISLKKPQPASLPTITYPHKKTLPNKSLKGFSLFSYICLERSKILGHATGFFLRKVLVEHDGVIIFF